VTKITGKPPLRKIEENQERRKGEEVEGRS
jgi:hypothetical protein